MANINVTIRMDEDLRKEASELFDELGMGLNQAINIFVRQAVREQRIPFSVSRAVLNDEIARVLKQIEKIKADPNYNTNKVEIETLMKDMIKMDNLSKKYFKY